MECLTEQDIKYIKGEKKIGYVFSFMIFCAGCLFNLVYYFECGIDSIMLVVNGVLLILCFLTPYFMNRKYNMDLKHGMKTIRTGAVQDKEHTKSYEAGSGNLYIPIIGDLFPKLWGSHPRLSYICYLTVNNIRYRVDKETYDRVEKGDIIEMYYTQYSQIVIGFGRKR